MQCIARAACVERMRFRECANKGKLNALMLVRAHAYFRVAFASLGTSFNICSIRLPAVLQKYEHRLSTRCLSQCFAGRKGTSSLGNCHCASMHCCNALRVNYQAAIWRCSLENSPHIPPDPSAGHEWQLSAIRQQTDQTCFMSS